jgi:photosystem II stability/assembly factor-like uncharacterized protein
MSAYRTWVQTRAALGTVAAAFVLASAGCDSGTDPDAECTFEQDGYCWEDLGPAGANVMALEETEWGLFAALRRGGVFRLAEGEWRATSLDTSEMSWGSRYIQAMLFVDQPNPWLFVSIHDARTYAEAAASGTLFASGDGGATWERRDSGLVGPTNVKWAYSLVQHPAEPSTLLMGTDWPILRSRDGGRSWHYVFGSADAFGHYMNVVVSPRPPYRFWAGGEDGAGRGLLLTSQDDGDSWSNVTPEPRPAFARPLLAEEGGRVWVEQGWLTPLPARLTYTDDGGGSWQTALEKGIGYLAQLETALYATSAVLADSAALPSSYDLVLYTSSDRGATWTEVPVPEGLAVASSIIADPAGQLLIGTRGDGVWALSRRE